MLIAFDSAPRLFHAETPPAAATDLGSDSERGVLGSLGAVAGMATTNGRDVALSLVTAVFYVPFPRQIPVVARDDQRKTRSTRALFFFLESSFINHFSI